MNTPPRPPLNRLEILRGLRLSTWEAVWATVWMVLTTGAFQIGFALYLGATPVTLGLLAGLPAAVGLLQLPASLYVERRGERKRFVAFASLLGRLLWLPILLLPFLLPRPLALLAFLALLTLSSILLTITVPAWTSWMSDLVPAESRGRYFGRRNMLAGIIAMLVPLPAGAFLDQAVKYGRFDPRIGFGVLFGIACAAALVACVLILRQPEPPREPQEVRSPLASLRTPFGDTNFRRFLFFAAAFVLGQTIAAQFFIAWQVGKQGLNLPYLTVQLLGAVASGASLSAMPLWGYLADKYGSRPVLALACGGVAISPFLWIFTIPRPDALWLNIGVIVLLNFIAGSFWAGFGLAQFNLLLAITPSAAHGTYVAAFSAVTGIVGGVAPIVGGAILDLLAPVQIPLGPFTLNNYKLLFLLAGLLRLSCLLLLRDVRDPEGHSTLYVLGQLRGARSLTSWWTLRRLSRPSRESERHNAVRQLADLRSPLAVEELVDALDDASLLVREGAVRALGEIGDARAVPALVAKLHDPAAGLGDLAAHALGFIGDRAATRPLMDAATGPDATVRLAALRALGRMGDVEAVPALVAALDPTQPATCEAACDALAALGPAISPEQAEEIAARLQSLLQSGAPRGVRLAGARALEPIAGKIALPTLYEALTAHGRTETDAAVAAQTATVLSRLRAATEQSVPEHLRSLLPILDTAESSPLAYKQALGAVARAGLGDDTFYPYLGLPEMAQQETMSKLLEEMRRRLRSASPSGSGAAPHPEHAVSQALEAFTAEEFVTCLRALAQLARRLPPDEPAATNAAAALDALARRADERAARGPESAAARAEECLLGALLLRRVLP